MQVYDRKDSKHITHICTHGWLWAYLAVSIHSNANIGTMTNENAWFMMLMAVLKCLEAKLYHFLRVFLTPISQNLTILYGQWRNKTDYVVPYSLAHELLYLLHICTGYYSYYTVYHPIGPLLMVKTGMSVLILYTYVCYRRCWSRHFVCWSCSERHTCWWVKQPWQRTELHRPSDGGESPRSPLDYKDKFKDMEHYT